MLRTVIHNHLLAHLNGNGELDEQVFQDAMAPYRNMWLQPEELWLSTEELQQMGLERVTDLVYQSAQAGYARKEEEFGAFHMRQFELLLLLRALDRTWMANLDVMEELKRGIGIRAYGASDPVVAYKKEGYDMFEANVAAIQSETVYSLFSIRLPQQQPKQPEKEAG